jgi:hypothetical protein
MEDFIILKQKYLVLKDFASPPQGYLNKYKGCFYRIYLKQFTVVVPLRDKPKCPYPCCYDGTFFLGLRRSY